jgi:hypothetical protein
VAGSSQPASSNSSSAARKTAHQVALDRLAAARERLKQAKDEAEAAAVATGDNAADRKKAAEKKVEAATLKEELAKIAVLCHDNVAPHPLGGFMNLPRDALEFFRPFGL